MSHEEHGTAGPCLNCGALPAGAWCQDCGQKAGPAHRSVVHLLHELAELLTHADSRIWRTLRDLVLHPARLSTDFLAGRRMRQIPPLRLFFVILLLLFTAGSFTQHGALDIRIPAATQTRIEAALDNWQTGASRLDTWLKPHLRRAAAQPDAVLAVMLDWLERFTLLMLPVAAALLWLCALRRRPRWTFFDHLVVSIHSLSFTGLVLIALFLSGELTTGAAWLLLLLPLHLFGHLRGVYRGGVVATLFRMGVLGIGSLVAAIGLLLALAAVGLQFGAH